MISSVIQKIIRFDIPVYDIELVHSSQGREQRSHIIFSLTYSHVVHVILHVQTKSFDVHNNISILMYISLASFHIIIIIFRATSYLTVGDETSFQIVIKYTFLFFVSLCTYSEFIVPHKRHHKNHRSCIAQTQIQPSYVIFTSAKKSHNQFSFF